MRIITAFLSIMLIVVVSANPVCAQTPDEAVRLSSQAVKLYQEGRYREAIPLAERALAIFEKALGPDHQNTATALGILAELYRAAGRYGEAEPLHKRSLAIYEKALGPDHPNTAIALNRLAELYRSRGRYGEAEPLYKRALGIREKALGPDHPNTATSLNNLAELYRATGRYGEAESLYKRFLAIREKALGPEHPNTAQSLNNLAGLYYSTGRYGEAEPLMKRDLAIWEKALGPDHPNTAQSLNNLAVLYLATGRYGEAEPLHKRSLAIREKALGPGHPSTAISLGNLAELYRVTGRYGETEPLMKRALAIREKALGPDHPDTALSLNNLAGLYDSTGRYGEAEPLYKRALAIKEKSLGPNHHSTATSLNNLAELYRATGRYGEAEPLHKRSLAIREKVLGPDHPDTATSLNNLAALYESTGRYGAAEPLYKRSLGIHEKAFGPDHPSTATSLNNLAELYRATGRYGEAEPLMKRALAIREKTLGTDHPDTALSLNNLAGLYDSTGRYGEAEPLYKRSLAIREKALGPDHPSTTTSLNNLAGLYLASGQLDEGYAIFKKRNTPMGLGEYHLLKKEYADARREFTRSLPYAKKAGQPHFLIANHIGLGLAFEGMKDWTAAEEHFREAVNLNESQWKTLSPDAKRNFLSARVGVGFTRIEAYEGLIRVYLKEGKRGYESASLAVAERVKGRLFLEMLATREIKGRTPEDEALLRQDREHQQALFSLRKQLEVLETQARGVSPEAIRTLESTITVKEREYTAFIEEVKLKGGEVSSLIAADPSGPEKIQSLLDADTTLLEYFTTKETTYVWLMTKNDLKVYEIPLSEKRLKEQVDSILLPNISNKQRKPMPLMVSVSPEGQQATSEQEREINRQQFSSSAKDLSELLLAPLQKDIHTKNLIIVPHGALHKVPFAVLTDTAYSLSILPSASVMEFVVKKRKPSKESLFLIANPKTDYMPLGYAEKEGKVIASFFPRKESYIREAATETITRKRAPSYQVIHFASHGEFNERQPLQSGLLLAKDAENDGYLQVHEIFGLDLPQANLVTLSACETALAKIQGGDDLVGLSRGFLYAGTPSLLATLWQVDDESTSLLMEQFYTNWLKKGMTKPEALRQAQISIRKIPRYRHPYYWAPFVMIGDWQ